MKVSTYYNACLRHLTSFFEGEDYDNESGVHHLISAAANLAVLRDAQHAGNVDDDRPPKIDFSKFREGLQQHMDKYKE